MENSVVEYNGNQVVVEDWGNRQRQRPTPIWDKESAGKVFDELIASHKDQRLNSKRAISGSITSASRVQNQNDRFISTCERELRRKDISEERRTELINQMERATQFSTNADKENRDFVRDEMARSRAGTWVFIGGVALLIVGGFVVVAKAA